ncbi:MAG: hypothetical protein DMG12_24115 [Acidobacteria bacterium]|nr:MAG: hypothetical protein DMG12_24115 [Acidobacteriota bacterium]
MAGFLDFCEDFFAANCANDANGPHRIAHIAVIAGGPFASFAQFAAQILVAAAGQPSRTLTRAKIVYASRIKRRATCV